MLFVAKFDDIIETVVVLLLTFPAWTDDITAVEVELLTVMTFCPDVPIVADAMFPGDDVLAAVEAVIESTPGVDSPVPDWSVLLDPLLEGPIVGDGWNVVWLLFSTVTETANDTALLTLFGKTDDDITGVVLAFDDVINSDVDDALLLLNVAALTLDGDADDVTTRTVLVVLGDGPFVATTGGDATVEFPASLTTVELGAWVGDDSMAIEVTELFPVLVTSSAGSDDATLLAEPTDDTGWEVELWLAAAIDLVCDVMLAFPGEETDDAAPAFPEDWKVAVVVVKDVALEPDTPLVYMYIGAAAVELLTLWSETIAFDVTINFNDVIETCVELPDDVIVAPPGGPGVLNAVAIPFPVTVEPLERLDGEEAGYDVDVGDVIDDVDGTDSWSLDVGLLLPVPKPKLVKAVDDVFDVTAETDDVTAVLMTPAEFVVDIVALEVTTTPVTGDVIESDDVVGNDVDAADATGIVDWPVTSDVQRAPNSVANWKIVKMTPPNILQLCASETKI